MKTTTLALAGAMILLGAGVSQAQPAPPPGGARMAMQAPDPAARAERRAQHLRDVLQLRPDQEGALRAFIDSRKPPTDWAEWAKNRRRGAGEAMTTPQRLDAMRARMGERQARFDQRANAIRAFYNQLSPAQKKAFDAMPQGRRGDEHKRMRQGGHGPR